MQPIISLGPEQIYQRPTAEWLVTNGIGGYASGTLCGVLTRRYHGLLTAALHPPLGRTTLVSKVDEFVTIGARAFDLTCNQWGDWHSPLHPLSYHYLNQFHLEGLTPVWTYRLGSTLVQKKIWMEYGKNTTYMSYKVIHGDEAIALTLKTMVNHKDFHVNSHAPQLDLAIISEGRGVRVESQEEDASPFYIRPSLGSIIVHPTWYRDYHLSQEAYRGLDALGDNLMIGELTVDLRFGQELVLVLSTDPIEEDEDYTAAFERNQTRFHRLADRSQLQGEPDWIQHLALAADQFIVQRQANGRSVIAGYHWFGDWGRDTMIALPGLTLATKRFDTAATILRTYARFVDQGMLPNRFPDSGGDEPEYNTVDATLWYFNAIFEYHRATEDDKLIAELFPVLEDIIAWHLKGTRYNIKVDAADGLLYAGESGVQLTWMDAKVKNWVVTPRIGKPVEINALWYNALCIMRDFALRLGKDTGTYDLQIEKAEASFQKFWNALDGYCYDILDGPKGRDKSLRPNQLFAVSLPHSPLSVAQQKSVVDRCADELLTMMGMRSLAPSDKQYTGRYGGNRRKRDSAYHQGTVWAWLIGPFVTAHYRVYQDAEWARAFLLPFRTHLTSHGIGSISENADGDPPFSPRACIAQAWSVAEVLRTWLLTRP